MKLKILENDNDSIIVIDVIFIDFFARDFLIFFANYSNDYNRTSDYNRTKFYEKIIDDENKCEKFVENNNTIFACKINICFFNIL